jgi:hypothetical protein
MIQIIAGVKGKGKTKHLIDNANGEIKQTKGTIVYLDKSDKHMYELSNKLRLINVMQYGIKNVDSFLGFVSGIISQDHDLDRMYFDSFLKIACLENQDISQVIDELDKIGDKFGVDFILSISMDEEHLPENAKSKILISL